MFIIKNKNIFLSLAAFLVLLSFTSIVYFGLKPGIDFTGGALTEVSYPDARPDIAELDTAIKTLGIGTVSLQTSGDNDLIIKSRDLTEGERVALQKTLSKDGAVKMEEKTFTSIGPSVGKELTKKAIIAISIVILGIILFIAFAFRKVSEPVPSWKYGLIAIVTLMHDIVIPSGVFAFLGHYQGVEVDSLFIVALLTVLGLSVSDTIVVFDRIRENLAARKGESFSDIVGNSLSQIFTRSINTSLTVIIALVILYFFGPDATKNFALVLSMGMFFGTYSSVFVASPILVLVEQFQRKKIAK